MQAIPQCGFGLHIHTSGGTQQQKGIALEANPYRHLCLLHSQNRYNKKAHHCG